jgi:hypothetical protein
MHLRARDLCILILMGGWCALDASPTERHTGRVLMIDDCLTMRYDPITRVAEKACAIDNRWPMGGTIPWHHSLLISD